MEYLFRGLIFLVCIYQFYSLSSFNTIVQTYETICFSDYFADNTLIFYQIQTNETVAANINDPQGNVMTKFYNKTFFKHSFTTFQGGHYAICINGNGMAPTKISYLMKFGIAAKDYSELAKRKDLKPVEINLQKLEDKGNEIFHLLAYSISYENLNSSLVQSLLDKISFFSILLLFVMILIGLLETLYLKSFLSNKKLI